MTKIEKTAIIEDNVTIGKNCYIGHYTLIRPNVVIGDNTEIRAHCFIAPGAHIGNNVLIMQYSNICQDAIIEDRVYIGLACILTNTRKIKHTRDFDLVVKPPRVEYGARVGSRVTVLPGFNIGKNSLIGVGSVITTNIPEGEVWFGIPAKYVKMVPKDELL